jgi:hypothetical protein
MLASAGCDSSSSSAQPPQVASVLLDLSGLAWIEGDLFVAVHDSKNNDEEKDRARVSLVRLPMGPDGITFENANLNWPAPLGESNDLESAARIPGEPYVLLMESGDGGKAGDGGNEFQRIFLAEYRNQRLTIENFTDWPVDGGVVNVEGAAVARLGNRFVFIFGERAEDEPSTQIQWAELFLPDLTFGPLRETTYNSPDLTDNRPLVGMDVDDAGNIYIVSAFDPDVDDGPFTSAIWHIGQVVLDDSDEPEVRLFEDPVRLYTLDGFKTESVALRENGGGPEFFAGTDDENYGATLRPLVSPD